MCINHLAKASGKNTVKTTRKKPEHQMIELGNAKCSTLVEIAAVTLEL